MVKLSSHLRLLRPSAVATISASVDEGDPTLCLPLLHPKIIHQHSIQYSHGFYLILLHMNLVFMHCLSELVPSLTEIQ